MCIAILHVYTTHSPSNRIRPDYEDALMGVATLLSDAGRMEEGLQFMDKAVEVAKGENPHVYNNLGAYLLKLGQFDQSVLLRILENLGLCSQYYSNIFFFFSC